MLELQIPNTRISIHPGDIVKLERFSNQLWEVDHGWFSFGGNRPFCGWYLKANIEDEYVEKPIQMTDLEDIYVVKKAFSKECICH